MTLDELKAKKVHIKVDKTIIIGENLEDWILNDILYDQKEEGFSDEDVIDTILNCYYEYPEDFFDYKDIKITIE